MYILFIKLRTQTSNLKNYINVGIYTYLAISLSISCSNCTNIGASIPIFAPLRATSNNVSTTCFSFFRQTRSSVSNMMHSITPKMRYSTLDIFHILKQSDIFFISFYNIGILKIHTD